MFTHSATNLIRDAAESVRLPTGGRMHAWAQRANPDVVLIMLGSNDLGANQRVDSTVDELRRIIDVLRIHNAEVTVLLGTVIPSTSPRLNQRILALNKALGTAVPRLHAEGSPVLLVDHHGAFDSGQDTYDGLHPNAQGASKLASNWLKTLNDVLPPPSHVESNKHDKPFP